MTEWSSVTPIVERFTGIRQSTLAEQRQIYEQVQEMKKQYPDSPLLNSYFVFDEAGGLRGSGLGIDILVNQIQIPGVIRTPTIREGFQLEKEGRLSNNVLRDYGITIFSESGVNTEIVKVRELALPAFVHYQALQLSEDGKEILLRKDFADDLIVSGNEARQYLKKFTWKENSGVRGLFRGGCGWCACGGSLFGSDAYFRVADFVRAEGTTQNLERDALSKLELDAKEHLTEYLANHAERVARARELIANK